MKKRLSALALAATGLLYCSPPDLTDADRQIEASPVRDLNEETPPLAGQGEGENQLDKAAVGLHRSSPAASSRDDCQPQVPDPCLPPAPVVCGKLPSARACVLKDMSDQSNMYTQVSFLYWEGSETGLEYAIKNKAAQFNENLVVEKPGFNGQPAARVQVGRHLPYDQWKLDLTYTIFYHKINSNTKHIFDRTSTTGFGAGLLAVWTAPLAFLGQNIYARWSFAESQWKLHFNCFDLTLRHDLCNGYALSFQPSFGVRVATVQQRYQVYYTDGNTLFANGAIEPLISSQVAMKNRSLNIGPCVGMGMKWSVASNWNIFGAVSAALTASHFTVGRNELDLSTNSGSVITSSLRFNSSYWTCRPQATANLGLRFTDCVCSKRSSTQYAISASYETQIWWKQNMLLKHYDAPNSQAATLAPVQGNLYYQGLTFDVAFDY